MIEFGDKEYVSGDLSLSKKGGSYALRYFTFKSGIDYLACSIWGRRPDHKISSDPRLGHASSKESWLSPNAINEAPFAKKIADDVPFFMNHEFVGSFFIEITSCLMRSISTKNLKK